MAKQWSLTDRILLCTRNLRQWAKVIAEDNDFPAKAQVRIRNSISVKECLSAVETLIDTFTELGATRRAENIAKQKDDFLSKVQTVLESLDKGERPKWDISHLQGSCIKLVGILESILRSKENVELCTVAEAKQANSHSFIRSVVDLVLTLYEKTLKAFFDSLFGK